MVTVFTYVICFRPAARPLSSAYTDRDGTTAAAARQLRPTSQVPLGGREGAVRLFLAHNMRLP